MLAFILIWERIVKTKYIVHVRGLRPFILEFLVGRVSGSLEPAAFVSDVLPDLLAAGPFTEGYSGLRGGSPVFSLEISLWLHSVLRPLKKLANSVIPGAVFSSLCQPCSSMHPFSFVPFPPNAN